MLLKMGGGVGLPRTLNKVKMEVSGSQGGQAVQQSRFSESQIPAILAEGRSGIPVA